tara:strand:+ start:379 stop:1299 length:921 start_codon:yes stop_codon:yes gene_type:complete
MPEFIDILGIMKPDVLHSGPVQTSGFMSALSGFHPFLLMSWGYDLLLDGDASDVSKRLTRFTLDASDMIVCDSHAVENKVSQITNYPKSGLVRFPWGVESEVFKPGASSVDFKSKLGWQDCTIVISNRSMEPYYGVEIAVNSFYEAYLINDELRLLLIGDGSLAPQVRSLINELGIDSVVYMPGRVRHDLLPEYLRAADIYLSCAYTDGSSVSLLEAMSTGLPSIVTDIPSNREWIKHDVNGWLARPGDSRNFSELLVQASKLETEHLSDILGKNITKIKKYADWNQNSRKLLRAYEKLYKDSIER